MRISIVCITLVRESLYTLLQNLAEQESDESFEVVLVAQPPGKLERQRIPPSLNVVVLEDKLGKGFGYYRQAGLDGSSGDVVAWIDDDEYPAHKQWLMRLTKAILSGDELVVTSGAHIPLGQGYVADGISWLGLPGGGYPGFETMWHVDDEGYTHHIHTGNLAFNKETIQKLGGFNLARKAGNEDVDLGDRLVENQTRIKFQKDALVIHEARTGLAEFFRWHVERGRAHRQFIRTSTGQSGKVSRRLASSLKVLRLTLFTRYFPIVAFLTALQYVAQVFGYLNLASYRRSDEQK